MGTIKHNAIIVTSWDYGNAKEAKLKCKEIISDIFKDYPLTEKPDNLVSDIIDGIANSQYTFFIAPDGSKEGWEPSNLMDEARENIKVALDEMSVDYIEVRFGGDDDYADIIASKS